MEEFPKKGKEKQGISLAYLFNGGYSDDKEKR